MAWSLPETGSNRASNLPIAVCRMDLHSGTWNTTVECRHFSHMAIPATFTIYPPACSRLPDHWHETWGAPSKGNRKHWDICIGGHRHRSQCRRYPTSDIDICYSDIGDKNVGLKNDIPISEVFRYRHQSSFRYPTLKKKIYFFFRYEPTPLRF